MLHRDVSNEQPGANIIRQGAMTWLYICARKVVHQIWCGPLRTRQREERIQHGSLHAQRRQPRLQAHSCRFASHTGGRRGAELWRGSERLGVRGEDGPAERGDGCCAKLEKIIPERYVHVMRPVTPERQH